MINAPIRCECGALLPRRAVWAVVANDSEVVICCSNQESALKWAERLVKAEGGKAEVIAFSDSVAIRPMHGDWTKGDV